MFKKVFKKVKAALTATAISAMPVVAMATDLCSRCKTRR